MYRIQSAEENIIMEVPQKIQIYTFSATLGNNGISIIIFNRPGVAGAVLQSPPSLINSFIH